MGTTKRPAALLAVVLGLIALAMLPALLGTSVFYLHDIELWFQPSREAFRASLVTGDFPLWQPQIGLGQPAAANPAQSAFYPGNVLLLLPDTGAVSRFIALHVVLAAGGMWLLARRLGRSPGASLIAAASFGFAGYTLSMATWSGTYLLSIAWMPAVIGLGLGAAGRPGARDSILFTLALACQILTGELQGVGFTVVITAGLVTARGQSARSAGVSLGALAVAMCVAVMLAMPQILPTLELLGDSSRTGGVALSEAQRLSMHPARFAELVVAGLYGSPVGAGFLGGFMAETTQGLSPTWMVSPYQGALALPLAAVAAHAATRDRDRVHLVLVALLVICALLAVGRHTPVHGLVTAIPGLDLFRYPAKYAAVVSLCLALLVARGVDVVRDSDRGWGLLLAGCAITGGLLLVAAGAVRASSAASISDSALARGGGVFIIATLAMVLGRKHHPSRKALVLAAVFVGDLGAINIAILETTDPAIYRDPSLATLVIRGDHEKRSQSREWPRVIVDPKVLGAGPGIDTANPELAALQIVELAAPNTGTAHGLAYPLPYAASLDHRHRRWVDETRSMMRVAMDIYGVHYLIAPGAAEFHESLALERIATLPERNATVFYNRAVRPLAYVADPVTTAASVDEAYAAIRDRERMQTRGAAIEASEVDAGGAAGECELAGRPADVVELSCRLDRHGWVVINVAHHGGWRAEVDGRPAEIARANGAVMAVAVAPGEHRLRLEYHQNGLRAGLLFAGMGALLLLALPLALWLRRRRRAPGETPRRRS